MSVSTIVSPMAEVTAAEFYRVIREQTEQLTALVNKRTDSLERALEDHKEEDRRIANLVLDIKVRREEEAKQALKNSGWMALIASAGFSGLLKWLWR